MGSKTRTITGALRFDPIVKEKVWGRELWELSDYSDDMSRVATGAFAGETLRSLLENFPEALLGAGRSESRAFPLLFKTLEATQTLSVQVHPTDDDCARLAPGSRGKTESWAIVDAAPGARIVHGIAPGVSRGEFLDRVADPDADPAELEALFAWRDVRRGDVVFLPAGTIHAIGGGIRLVEVQQSSDITYRLYDWGRPRELHLAQAREVSSPSEAPPEIYPRWQREGAGTERWRVVTSPYFSVDAVSIRDGEALDLPLDGGFGVVIGLEGSARLESPAGGTVNAGDFVLVPASNASAAIRATDGAFSGLWVRG